MDTVKHVPDGAQQSSGDYSAASVDEAIRPAKTQSRNRAIVCSCDDHYIPHLATMLQTLVDTNDVSGIELYLITSGQKSSTERQLQQYLDKLGICCVYLRVDHGIFAGFPLSGHISHATYYRLAIPGLLPTHLTRALYIDVDTCVTGDLSRIWDLDLQGFALAAVRDPNQPEADKARLGIPADSGYLNAGVMLMNLEKLREAELISRSVQYLQHNLERVMWWDQDLLNVLLSDDWLELPPVWNLLPKHDVTVERDYRAMWCDSAGVPCIDQVRIVHFAGGGWSKPWHYNCTSPYRHTYLEARAKTPWWKFRPTGKPSLASRIRNRLGLAPS
jgi:hypothetical protein